MTEINEQENRPLSDAEQVFVDSYVVHLKKIKAALDAGYEPNSARQQGYQIYNRPHVRAAIDKILKARAISAEETVELVAKNAQNDLADFFTPVTRQYTPQIKVGLQEVIDRIQREIDFEYAYRERVEMDEDANDAWFQMVQGLKDRKIRYELELELNPNATRIIDGETELIQVQELDINKLIESNQRGQIKSVKYDKDGRIQIEGYDALAAQDKLMRMHGKFEKDNEQLAPKMFDPTKLSSEELLQVISLSKKANGSNNT
jgi:phage terminase small subunit